ELGAAPPSTLIRTVVTGPDGRTRVGETHVTVPDFTSLATALAFMSNLDRVFDHTGQGSTDINYTISGTTAGGQPFTLTRGNRFADASDVSFSSIFDPMNDVDALINNDITGVSLDKVQINATMSNQVRSFHVAKVQVRRKGVWRTMSPHSLVRVKH